MPVIRRGDALISYAEHGSGFPVLALAPGGMRSAASFWPKMPWDPVARLADRYRVITMDQRNAGDSTAPVTGEESWATYTADQLAVLDHLGVDRCHVVGMCIGGPFILGLLRAAPARFARAVVLQSIGQDGNREAFHDMFAQWRSTKEAAHPEADAAAWDGYLRNLYDVPDVLFSVPTAALPGIGAPMLVLQGDDQFHPRSASRLIASSVPGARLVERWKEPEDLPAAAEEIAEFLAGA
ncbi:MAG TPA: alpha/beta hydrolase [Pseudonocardia sp.]|jgi:pimeloyl-ACP methyl ester carboxylesterase